MTDRPRDAAADRRRAFRRLPLRIRLVAGFSLAITVVLLAAGAFVYWRVTYALDLRLNADAQQAVKSLAPLVSPDGVLHPEPATAATEESRLFQVLDARGRVLSSGADLRVTPLLPASEVVAALRAPLRRDVGGLLPRSAHPLRLLAVPILANQAVLVVAVRRDQRDEALRELLAQLAIAGAGSLVISAFVGERLAKAALAPVERYRNQAAAIASGATGVRLDVPPDRHDEVTRLGDTLNTMLAALENTVAREKRFTADASHELRTPLTLLSTRVQLTLSRDRSSDEYERALHELQIDIDELSVLATHLLELSAAENHPAALTSVPAVVALLRAIVVERPSVSLHVNAARTSEQETPGRAGTTGFLVPVGPTQLRQILNNLLDNAQTHGTTPVDLRAEVDDKAGSLLLRLTVTDAGTGLPPEFLPFAVERFARGEGATDLPGAGLGLALVAELVSTAGGELRLCSRGVHHRVTAAFDLPCAHAVGGTTASVLLPVRVGGPG